MPSSATPSEVAMALTVIEGNRFEKITHWDYVNHIRHPKTRRLELFEAVRYLIKIWVQRTVLECERYLSRSTLSTHSLRQV